MGNSKTKPESPPKESGAPNSSLSYSSVPFQLQIRNCLRNVRGNSENSFNDVCPDQCAPSTSTRKLTQNIVYLHSNTSIVKLDMLIVIVFVVVVVSEQMAKDRLCIQSILAMDKCHQTI